MTNAVAPAPYVSYLCSENGMSFSIKIQQNSDGVFYAKITMIEGYGDINALYFGDSTDDGTDYTLGNKLGMNGAGQSDHNGNPVDWDGAVKLSDPGLGKHGVDKDTYLTAGDSLIVPLFGIDSFDDISTVGVRATSTSTPEGSIKCVGEYVSSFPPIEDTAEEPPSADLADPTDVGPSDTENVAVTEPLAPVVPVDQTAPTDAAPTADAAPPPAVSSDLAAMDDATYYETLAQSVGVADESVPAPVDDEPVYEDFMLF